MDRRVVPGWDHRTVNRLVQGWPGGGIYRLSHRSVHPPGDLRQDQGQVLIVAFSRIIYRLLGRSSECFLTETIRSDRRLWGAAGERPERCPHFQLVILGSRIWFPPVTCEAENQTIPFFQCLTDHFCGKPGDTIPIIPFFRSTPAAFPQPGWRRDHHQLLPNSHGSL